MDLTTLGFDLPVTGLLDVSTEGSLGPSGSVASSASAADVFTTPEVFGIPFTAALIETECSAALDGVTGSTTIVDGVDVINSVPIPVTPEANTVILDEILDVPLGAGVLRFTFFLVVNEQVVGTDSITVTGARLAVSQEFIFEGEDPLLVSDLEATFSHSECGIVPGAIAPPTFTG